MHAISYVSLLYFHRVFKKASPNGKVILRSFFPSFMSTDHFSVSVVYNMILQRFSVSVYSIACYEMVMSEQPQILSNKVSLVPKFDLMFVMVSQTDGSQLAMAVRLAYSLASSLYVSLAGRPVVRHNSP